MSRRAGLHAGHWDAVLKETATVPDLGGTVVGYGVVANHS